MNEPAPSPPPPPVAADAPSGRRRLRLVALGVIAVILVGGLWLAFRSPADLVQGMADADSINVSAKVTARVSALLVAEGERVEAGQVLFELDSPEIAAKQQQAEAALAAHRQGAVTQQVDARVAGVPAARSGLEPVAATGPAVGFERGEDLGELGPEGVVVDRLAQARQPGG